MCVYCQHVMENGREFGLDYPIHACGNGDLGARAQYINGGIILFVDRHTASGYFDINFCPICGRKIEQKRGW